MLSSYFITLKDTCMEFNSALIIYAILVSLLKQIIVLMKTISLTVLCKL